MKSPIHMGPMRVTLRSKTLSVEKARARHWDEIIETEFASLVTFKFVLILIWLPQLRVPELNFYLTNLNPIQIHGHVITRKLFWTILSRLNQTNSVKLNSSLNWIQLKLCEQTIRGRFVYRLQGFVLVLY